MNPSSKLTLDGIKDGLPVLFGYLPYGIAYGLLAKQAGLTLFGTLLMSGIVYAGTSQFVAVAMIQSGQEIFSIVLSTLIINLRYLLMNGALSQLLAGWTSAQRFFLSLYVSDETFVVLTNKANQKALSPQYAFAVNAIALAGWVLSSFLGYTAGAYIPDLRKFGFDFALVAVLIALSSLMTKNRIAFFVGLSAGVISIALHILGYQKFNVLAAALIASFLGVFISWNRKKS